MEENQLIRSTIETYFDRKNLRTSNVYGAIWVRHKILSGALLGTVHTEATGGTWGNVSVGISQAGIWSEWILLAEHTGAASVSISNRYSNDILVVSEVRYWAPNFNMSRSIDIFSTIAVICRGYLLGYSMVRPSADMGDAVSDITRSISGLFTAIDELDNALDDVAQQIANLDIVLAGEIDKGFVRQAWYDAKITFEDISNLCSTPLMLKNNTVPLREALRDLARFVNRIISGSSKFGEVSALAAISPIVAGYAKIYTYVQRQVFINAGDPPEAAGTGFEQSLTQITKNYLNNVKKEYDRLELFYKPYAVEGIPKILYPHRFTKDKGFVPDELVTIYDMHENVSPKCKKRCQGSTDVFCSVTCFVKNDLQNQSTPEFKNLYQVSQGPRGEYRLHATKWKEFKLGNQTYKGYVYEGLNESWGDSHDLEALKHFNQIKKSHDFFTNRDGKFFEEIDKFDSILHIINNKIWDGESSMVKKHEAYCLSHGFSSIHSSRVDAQNALKNHEHAGHHPITGVKEIWD